MPELGNDNVYRLEGPSHHAALLSSTADAHEIVVLKCYAPWCRACKGLAPKFAALANDPSYNDQIPIQWAELSVQNNKDFVRQLGVMALPTVQFYVNGKLYDTFPCGPSKVPVLKRKLAALLNEAVDPHTRQLKSTFLENLEEQPISPATTVQDVTATATNETSTYDTTITTTTTTTTNGITAPTPTSLSREILVTGVTKDVTVDDKMIEQQQQEQQQQSKETPGGGRRGQQLVVTPEERQVLMRVPYLRDLKPDDVDAVLSKARLLTFEPASIIMREGRPGRTFYVIQQGEVEVCQQLSTGWGDDPFSLFASSSSSSSSSRYFLGTVINRLGAGDYFGERALITGEPRAASIRTMLGGNEAVKCWAFDQDDFPPYSLLSGKISKETWWSQEFVDTVNDKYGVTLSELYDAKSNNLVKEVSTASQVRGSVNTPHTIRGVDTDEDLDALVDDDFGTADTVDSKDKDSASSDSNSISSVGFGVVEDQVAEQQRQTSLLDLLVRFNQIRLIRRCFDYIVQTRAVWWVPPTPNGDPIRRRRAVLVSRLTSAQRDDFDKAFQLIEDTSSAGTIGLSELQQVMEQIGIMSSSTATKSGTDDDGDDQNDDNDDDAQKVEDILMKAGGGNKVSKNDFIGIMAEAEFYYLFRDLFASLDPQRTGFVKAYELDKVLCGVRNLISDDANTQRNSLIDGMDQDQDMLIDYEQFTRMILGTPLV